MNFSPLISFVVRWPDSRVGKEIESCLWWAFVDQGSLFGVSVLSSLRCWRTSVVNVSWTKSMGFSLSFAEETRRVNEATWDKTMKPTSESNFEKEMDMKVMMRIQGWLHRHNKTLKDVNERETPSLNHGITSMSLIFQVYISWDDRRGCLERRTEGMKGEGYVTTQSLSELNVCNNIDKLNQQNSRSHHGMHILSSCVVSRLSVYSRNVSFSSWIPYAFSLSFSSSSRHNHQ